jgi:anthranilate synthase component II
MQILLLDNYDSFTYNLLHYLESIDGVEVSVRMNDEIDLLEIEKFDAVVLSPGPGLPKESGKLMNVISESIWLKKPILGVCLGMQALGEHFGARLYNQENVKHGVAEKCMLIKSSPLFENIPLSFKVGLYHSWAVNIDKLEVLEALAYSENNVLMSFHNLNKRVFGVQFHPESILTEHGFSIIENFINFAKAAKWHGI